jgi:hypothetical protein
VPPELLRPERPSALPPDAAAPQALRPEPVLPESSPPAASPASRVPPATGGARRSTSTWGPQPRRDNAHGRGAATPDGLGDLIEVVGPLPGEPVLVSRRWIASLAAQSPASGVAGARSHGAVQHCHPVTGALLGPTGALLGPTGALLGPTRALLGPTGALLGPTGALLGPTDGGRDAYRPSAALGALVRLRDGRCRFPGCSVAARFCDLDHVRPWPAGPTTAPNLMCLCRRHHRIKQRPGWRVALAADVRAVWTDPTGRLRTSWPRDLLDVVVLPARRETLVVDAKSPAGPSPDAPLLAVDVGRSAPVRRQPWSVLEACLEVVAEHAAIGGPAASPVRDRTPSAAGRVRLVPPDPRRRLVLGGPGTADTRRPTHAVCPRSRGRLPMRTGKADDTGPPPF